MPIKEVAIAAIIASQGVTDGPNQKVVMGGELAIHATELCIQDHRDIEKGFILQHMTEKGVFKVHCQTLSTQQGLYYASKGSFIYHDDKMLPLLIDLFEKSGREVD